jgi:hypothetical protein
MVIIAVKAAYLLAGGEGNRERLWGRHGDCGELVEWVKLRREVGVLEASGVEIFCGDVPRGTFFRDPVQTTDAESAEVRRGTQRTLVF